MDPLWDRLCFPRTTVQERISGMTPPMSGNLSQTVLRIGAEPDQFAELQNRLIFRRCANATHSVVHRYQIWVNQQVPQFFGAEAAITAWS